MNDITETKERNPLVVFKDNFKRLIEAKELALPSTVSEDAFRNAAIIAVQDNPGLLMADQQSLFKSIRKAAAAGLVPDGREGALVTFKTKDKESNSWIDKVQFMPMVFGLIKMARRSGTVADIRAHIVYQGEVDKGQFSYVIGDSESLTHEPILFGDRGAPVAAYAIAKLTDGTIVREFMSADDIDVVRRAGSSQRIYAKGTAPVVSAEPIGIWKDWASEMWKKTVIRRMTKRLDLSSEDIRHIQEDDDFTGLRDVTPEAPKVSAFAAKALAAREAAAPERDQTPDDTTEPTANYSPDHSDEDIPDAETVEHWTFGINPDDGMPGSEAWNEGMKAAQAGMKPEMCPHEGDPVAAADWLGGFFGARRAGE
jgi:recombination protein RecT